MKILKHRKMKLIQYHRIAVVVPDLKPCVLTPKPVLQFSAGLVRFRKCLLND